MGVWFHHGKETVPAPADRFDEAGRAGTVIQRQPYLPYRGIQPVIKVNERMGWPKLLLEFFTCD